jgi:predicted cupin superfamily sugar epimerase
MKASEIIEKLKLIPMPDEGGYYRETYRSDIPKVAAGTFDIDSNLHRSISTAIFYFVVPESFSALHKVRSDEMFHFYSGDAVEMVQIDESGKESHYSIGNKIENGEVPQVVVPRGVWQGCV